MTEAERCNRAIATAYHQGLASGDFDAVIALHAPQVVVWMCGDTLVSGRFQGRDALFDHMLTHVVGPLVTDGESYVKAARIVAADDRFVAGYLRGGFPNRCGGRYDQTYLQIFRVADGLIQEIVEFFDTVMFEQAVLGHMLATPRVPPACPFVIPEPLAGTGSVDAVRALAARFTAAALAGDWRALAAVTAPAMAVEVPGSTPHAGVHTDWEPALVAVLDRGVAFCRLVFADAGAAILLLRGGDADRQFAVVLECTGERIARITIFEDTLAVERQRFGNPMLPAQSTSVMPPFDVRLAFAA